MAKTTIRRSSDLTNRQRLRDLLQILLLRLGVDALSIKMASNRGTVSHGRKRAVQDPRLLLDLETATDEGQSTCWAFDLMRQKEANTGQLQLLITILRSGRRPIGTIDPIDSYCFSNVF
jgi:hypothetical protein